jgi:hypothetical protein
VRAHSYIWLLPCVEVSIENDCIVLARAGHVIRLAGLGQLADDLVLSLDGTRCRLDLESEPVWQIVLPILESAGWLVGLDMPRRHLRINPPNRSPPE